MAKDSNRAASFSRQEWEQEFAERLSKFASNPKAGQRPVSIKIRPIGSCFCRHNTATWRIIDEYLSTARKPIPPFIEHETGPEILAMIGGAIGLAAGILDLILVIIRAREEGGKEGDGRANEFEVSIRTTSEGDRVDQQIILRVRGNEELQRSELEAALKEGMKSALESQPQIAEAEALPQQTKPRERFEVIWDFLTNVIEC